MWRSNQFPQPALPLGPSLQTQGSGSPTLATAPDQSPRPRSLSPQPHFPIPTLVTFLPLSQESGPPAPSYSQQLCQFPLIPGNGALTMGSDSASIEGHDIGSHLERFAWGIEDRTLDAETMLGRGGRSLPWLLTREPSSCLLTQPPSTTSQLGCCKDPQHPSEAPTVSHLSS